MNKIKALAVAVGLMGGSYFLIGDTPEHTAESKAAEVQQEAIISEIHILERVTPTEIYGENAYQGGEGIYYTRDMIDPFLDGEELKAGDKVEIQWTESSVQDEDWLTIHSFRVID